MPPKAAADKGDKMFSADVVAAVLYCIGTTSLSMKNYEMMSSLDGKKSAYGFQHDFRSVIAKAKELKARVESGEDFEAVPSSAKRLPTRPSSTVKKGKRATSGSDVDETPSKKRTKVKEAKPVPAPKFVPGPSKGILSAQGISESVPDDAEDFIKGEDRWEDKYV